MNILANDYPTVLLGNYAAPCLSLYQRTHRQHPEKAQDPIRFRNLVKQLEESLRQKYPAHEMQTLLQPFEALAADRDFWNHASEGLAVFSASGLFRVYPLQRPVANLAVVADSFLTKPLIRIVQSADRYHILGLSRGAFKLFEGNRDALSELAPLDDVPQTAPELLHKTLGGAERSDRVYGPAGVGSMTRHDTDIKRDAIKKDTKLFFRAVDEAVREHHSQPSGLPLILAGLAEHHKLFREVSRNPALMQHAIDVNPDAISIEALRERAWQVVQPNYLERLAGLVEKFGVAMASGHGTDKLADIAAAATAGRIATLLIEADRLIPGRIEAPSGALIDGDLSHPEMGDLLDDCGERVLKAKGDVVIVPAERMPTQTGAAAIYRY